MQPTDTKEIIIRKSFELLLSKGFDGVSISDIQQATGFARGLLYHYFGSKEALFLEAIEYHFVELFQVNLEQIKGYNVDQMRAYIIAKYRKLSCETLKGASIVNYDFLFYRAMQQNPEFARLYQRMRDDERLSWLIALNNSQQKGEIRADLNIEKLALQFVYATDGVWMAAVSPPGRQDLFKELNDALTTLYSLIKTE